MPRSNDNTAVAAYNDTWRYWELETPSSVAGTYTEGRVWFKQDGTKVPIIELEQDDGEPIDVMCSAALLRTKLAEFDPPLKLGERIEITCFGKQKPKTNPGGMPYWSFDVKAPERPKTAVDLSEWAENAPSTREDIPTPEVEDLPSQPDDDQEALPF